MGEARRAEVHDERQVGLVEAHPERRGRDERLDPVLLEVLLQALALGRVGLAGVRGDGEPRRAQLARDLLGRGDGEAVDDARAVDVLQRLDEPRDARGLVRQAQDGEVEGLAVQPAAQDEHVLVARLAGSGGRAGRVRRGHAELLRDVRGHARVRGRRRREHGDAGRQVGEQRADAAVVGPEVVPPVGDAVRLVDDDEARVGREPGEHLVAEAGVVEPLRRAQQHVDLTVRDGPVHVVPLGDVGGVDGDGLDARPRGGRDLVAHERQERGDDDGRPGSAVAQQARGHEVHGGLAPPGALHDERTAPERHEGLDRAPLVLAQRRALAPHERAQRGLGVLAQRLPVEQAAQHGELGPLGGLPAVGRGGGRAGR